MLILRGERTIEIIEENKPKNIEQKSGRAPVERVHNGGGGGLTTCERPIGNERVSGSDDVCVPADGVGMRRVGRRVGRYIGARPVGTRDGDVPTHAGRRTRMTMQPASCQAIGIFQPYYIIIIITTHVCVCTRAPLAYTRAPLAYTRAPLAYTRARTDADSSGIGTYRVHVRRGHRRGRVPPPLPPGTVLCSSTTAPRDSMTAAAAVRFFAETYRAGRALVRP